MIFALLVLKVPEVKVARAAAYSERRVKGLQGCGTMGPWEQRSEVRGQTVEGEAGECGGAGGGGGVRGAGRRTENG